MSRRPARPTDDRPTCNCNEIRPKSSPPVYCSCRNKCDVGENLCVSCQRGRHVY